MGLDMYLSAKRYVSEYSGGTELTNSLLTATEKALGYLPKRQEGTTNSIEITVPLMYWRKFNALHNWFVREVQDGKDECQDAYVTIEKLRELDKLVAELFMARRPILVIEKMPPTSGFFFGSTDIDEWFWETLRETMDGLHQLIADLDAGKLEGWSIYYRSSW